MIAVSGLDDAVKAFNERLNDVEAYSARAMVDIILDLTGKAVALAPVDTGDLRGSGYGKINGEEIAKGKSEGGIEARRPNMKKTNLAGEVGFNTPYALKQHEEVEFSHPRGGQAKYLEEPFKKNSDKYIKHLEDSVKKAVE